MSYIVRSDFVYSDALAEEICRRLCYPKARSLNKVCSDDDMPSVELVYKWLRQHEAFKAMYISAHEIQADIYASETIDIAENVDTYIDKEGNVRVDAGSVAKARLMIDARTRYASALHPKKYLPQRVEVNIAKDNDSDQSKARLAELRAIAAARSLPPSIYSSSRRAIDATVLESKVEAEEASYVEIEEDGII